MILRDKEVSTIEEALELFSEEERAHAERIACYSEACFVRAATKFLYNDELKGSNEIVPENREYAYKSGLYHDLGKLVTDDPDEQGVKGVEIIQTLYPKFKQEKSYHQRMLTEGALDNREHYDGSGKPEGKHGRQIGYMGRIVALANEIDERAMKKASEDPIGDVLKELKSEIADGRFDPNFFQCFTTGAAQLRKAFSENSQGSKAVAVSENWIKRRESRPMELRYKKVSGKKSKDQMILAEMRIRATKGEYTSYDDMKKLINASKLGPELGAYFLYELLDALKRFSCCNLEFKKAFIKLPEMWYTKPKLSEDLEQIFKDEETEISKIEFLIPESLAQKPTKSFQKNLETCKALGAVFTTAEEFTNKYKILSENLLHEDEIASEGITGESEANG